MALVAASASAAAQSTSPTLSDATVVARGAFRVHAAVEWTRFDGIFGPNGSSVLPLGASLTTNLNVSSLPLLKTGQTAARTLAADPSLMFSAGQLTTSADSRIATVPLTAEYGLTSRLTLGAVLPIVQSRTVVTWQANGRKDSSANVGANPAAFHFSPAAYSANLAVATGLTTARDQLQARIAFCTLNTTATGCPAINARSAEAAALLSTTSSFVIGINQLYGTSLSDAPGAVFVPITGSAPQNAIDARLASIRASYTSFGFSAGSSALAAAQAAAANQQMQTLLQDPAYGIVLDSLGTTQQTAIGDVELSATFKLFDTWGPCVMLDQYGSCPTKIRAAVAGVVRLGTGHSARENRPYDVPTGDGQTDYEVRGALDAVTGRLLTTIAGTYTLQTGSVATTRLPNVPGALFGLDFPVEGSIKYGNMAAVRVNPRFMITPALMVGALGVGSFRGADEVTVTGFNPAGTAFGNQNSLTTYAGGLTLSYSNLAGTESPWDFPTEILFSHLETLKSSGAGAQKGTRDAIEMRVYLRARR